MSEQDVPHVGGEPTAELSESVDDYPVTVRFPVHWGEMDALGHVNNTRYFAWFETVRIAAFERIALGAEPLNTVGPILATTQADFLEPVSYPASVVVGCRIPKVGNTSFVMQYAVAHQGRPSHVVARGTAVVVLVNYKTGEKLRVPDAMRQAIAAL